MNPIKQLGLAVHEIAKFNAVVDGNLTKKELQDPKLWVHVANKMPLGCEVRILGDDMSFRAIAICTYVRGSDIVMNVVEYAKLDKVDYDALDNQHDGYVVKLRGMKKWCIVKQSTGEIVKELIPNQAQALKELQEYIKALAA